jgi:genome maintenance exonuclease 1
MKTFIHHDFAKLERDTAADGRRVYKTPLGKLYPSVTSITGINSTFNKSAWIQRVGPDEAERVTQKALSRGTRVHSLCENYLLGNNPTVDIFDMEMWSTMRPLLDDIDNIHCLETPLYSDFLQAAGTVDCIAEYKGRLSVIDFKTSSRVKERSDIYNYFEQTAAYSVMFEERTGIPIDRLVIMMVIDDEAPRVFVEKRDSWIAGFRKARLDYRQKYNI